MKRAAKWIFVAIIILLLVVAVFRFDGENLLYSVRQVPAWLVAVLVGLQVVTQLLVNTLWHQIAKISGVKVSFSRMLYVNCQGAIIDAVTPGVKFGGEVTRAVQLRKFAECSGEQAAAVVALQKLFSLSALFIIFIFMSGIFIAQVEILQIWYLQALLYAILFFGPAVFLGILFAPGRVRVFFKNPPRFLITLTDSATAVRENKKRTPLFALSFFIWLLYPVKLYLLAVQFAPCVSLAQVGAVAFFSYMVAMIPIFPGGLGGFEGTMSGLLAALGFAISDAAVITALFRFTTFWLIIPASLIFIFFKRRRRASQ